MGNIGKRLRLREGREDPLAPKYFVRIFAFTPTIASNYSLSVSCGALIEPEALADLRPLDRPPRTFSPLSYRNEVDGYARKEARQIGNGLYLPV